MDYDLTAESGTQIANDILSARDDSLPPGPF